MNSSSEKRTQKQKESPLQDRAYLFAIRRLVRYGSITKVDIMATMDCSPVTASNVIKDIKRHDRFVTKEGQKLILKDGGVIHPEWLSITSDKQLAQAIESGGQPELTGMTRKELPVQIRTLPTGALSDELMAAISKCLIHQAHQDKNKNRADHRAALSILYVGMGKKETAKWRTVIPICIERILDQWRLVAQAINKEGYPIESYVITRIIDYRAITEPLPKGLLIKSPHDSQTMVTVKFSADLTNDQETVLRNEMKVSKPFDRVQIEGRLCFDFLYQFSNQATNSEQVWPIVTAFDIRHGALKIEPNEKKL